eukprot:TRINITY_DN3116_c0_g1_i1.p2 TRINITY_DN3116_c0_g1~~TRINITY_DN3116_c0_g1_i1.p2  ORF type:complete len:304 (+),score=27.38 TRINITY_DN3116_c0_g1_i1:386-1297(+)
MIYQQFIRLDTLHIIRKKSQRNKIHQQTVLEAQYSPYPSLIYQPFHTQLIFSYLHLSQPSALAMQFLAGQQKLGKFLNVTTEESQKCKEILDSRQSMVMSLLDNLEALKEKQKQTEMEELSRKLNTLEQNMYFQPPRNYYREKYNLLGRETTSAESGIAKNPPLKVLPEEEVKKLKGNYLSTKEKKESLLRAMGINPEEDQLDFGAGTGLENLDFENMKFSIRDKLKALKENKWHKTNLTPIQKWRGIARVIAAFLFLRSHALKNFGKMKEEQQVYFTHDINLHLDIARAWLLQSIRSVILSV